MIVQDIRGHVDRTYRTVKAPGGRAVAGRSSGGYASWQLVRRFPGIFGHIASHSADSYFEYCYLPEFPRAASALAAAGGVNTWWSGFERRVRETKMGGDDHAVVNLPPCRGVLLDPSQPLGVDCRSTSARPGSTTGLALWLADDPVRFVERDPRPSARCEHFIDWAPGTSSLRWGRGAARAVAGGRDGGPRGIRGRPMGTAYRFDRSLAFLTPAPARVTPFGARLQA
jgi:hypothetical protein